MFIVMAKNVYSKPLMVAEKFTPQAYCETCTNQTVWRAHCTDMDGKGYIFYDAAGDAIFAAGVDDIPAYTEPHGGCGKYHDFVQDTKPGFNAWVLNQSYVSPYGAINDYCDYYNGHYHLKSQYRQYLKPALVKEPGQALDHNWLVCYEIQGVRNPGS